MSGDWGSDYPINDLFRVLTIIGALICLLLFASQTQLSALQRGINKAYEINLEVMAQIQ